MLSLAIAAAALIGAVAIRGNRSGPEGRGQPAPPEAPDPAEPAGRLPAGGKPPNLGAVAAGAAAGAGVGTAIDQFLGGGEVTRATAQVAGGVVGAAAAAGGATLGIALAPVAALAYGISQAYQVNLDTQYGAAQQNLRGERPHELADPVAAAEWDRANVAAYLETMAMPRGLGMSDDAHLDFHLGRGRVAGTNAGGGRLRDYGSLHIYDWRSATPLEPVELRPPPLPAAIEQQQLQAEQTAALAEASTAATGGVTTTKPELEGGEARLFGPRRSIAP